MKLIIWLAALIIPFQLLGAAAYHLLASSDARRAHLAGALVPAVAFFAVLLALFLWSHYHPGGMLLVEGAFNLLLIAMAVGTALHLVGGGIAYYIHLRRGW